MDYNIISTGSQGNAVIINRNLLIDCGVPFRALKPYYKELQLVLLTHQHMDHFNKTTIRKLAQERPTLRWGCCEWLITLLISCGIAVNRVDVYTPGCCFVYNEFCTIKPEATIHNVDNCAYHIWRGADSLFYATDTNSLDGIEAKDYCLYMIESNYSEAEITERIRQKQERGEYCHEWDVLKNHLSKEKADNWLYRNMGSNSSYVYLHQHTD